MMKQVAIIGAGPAGLAAARWLKHVGFDPILIDSHSGVGGQWDYENENSGIWPQMVTNTFKEGTKFSDLDYPEDTPIFPHNRQVLSYFQSYCDQYNLAKGAKFNTKLLCLEQTDKGYLVTLEDASGRYHEEFSNVIVATGRYNKPSIPPIAGLSSFSGKLGVRHAFDYKDPTQFRDARVLVAGGSISALEIASDLSMMGAKSVHLAQRRQRYVMPKMVMGVPFEYYGFTFEAAKNGPETDQEKASSDLLKFALKYGGDPEKYGAPAPDGDPMKAGFTGSQLYLNLVAEGRIKPVLWIDQVDGNTVTCTDGSTLEVDGIIFGTGFDLNLPFLSPEIKSTLEVTTKNITLSDFTFHPELPNLAFAGLWSQNGSYQVPIEQQARHIAYSWSEQTPLSDEYLRQGVEKCRQETHHADYQQQNEMALRFGRLCGTSPEDITNPETSELVNKSATTGLLYRLSGPDALPDSALKLRKQFECYGPLQEDQ